MVLNEQDREMIAAIQGGLPLVAKPYAAIAAQLGLTEDEVIARLEALQTAGLIKRMGVVVKHRALGYRANAMVVWDIPADEVERVGALLADESCVTLCYQRPRRLPAWGYNLFCMIHGRERDSVLRRLEQIVAHHRLEKIPHTVLFSCRSFKQRGARYVETDNVGAGLPANRAVRSTSASIRGHAPGQPLGASASPSARSYSSHLNLEGQK